MKGNFRSHWARLAAGTAGVAALLTLGFAFGGGSGIGGGGLSVSDAKECLRQGANVYFNVTLGTEAYLRKLGEWEGAKVRSRMAQAFVVSANTHVGTIRDLDLREKIFLESDDVQFPSSGAPLASTTHHNTYLVYFPRFGHDGRPIFERPEGDFAVIIKGIDRIEVRRFAFSHPLPLGRVGGFPGWGRSLMLLGAVFAALLLACTPCLLGSLSVGTLTMGSSWIGENGDSTPEWSVMLKSQMARRTAYFLGAIVVCYLAVVALVNLAGLQVEDLRPVEGVGGMVLILIGAYLFSRLERVRAWLFRLRWPGLSMESSMGAGASAAMGGSLAVVCSVAGAPTLTTAIVLPVMVYLGLSDLGWALALIAAYLVVCALPFFAIAMGLGEALLRLATRHQQKVLLANSLLLLALGLLLALDSERVARYVAWPAEAALKLLSLVL